MKRRYRLLIGLFGVLGFLFFLPRDLSTSFTITPESSFTLGESETVGSGPPVPFATSRFVGFLNGDGSPRVTEPVRYGAAVSSSGYLNYDFGFAESAYTEQPGRDGLPDRDGRVPLFSGEEADGDFYRSAEPEGVQPRG